MTDIIRCPACRGSRRVPKLGGMIGDCSTCQGKGTILASEKPIPVKLEPQPVESVIVKSVADCVPATTIEEDVKIDGKKALYKRKKA